LIAKKATDANANNAATAQTIRRPRNPNKGGKRLGSATRDMPDLDSNPIGLEDSVGKSTTLNQF
jgi:hypothetical protein